MIIPEVENMKKVSSCFWSVFAVVTMSLGISVSTFAQGAGSSISGFVFDSERRPVSQVVVELKNEFSIVGRTRTDGSGRFYFSGLGHGRFTIIAKPLGTGWQEQSVDVELAGVGSRGQSIPDNQYVDIYLKPRPGGDSVPFQAAVIYAQEVPEKASALYEGAEKDLAAGKNDDAVVKLEEAIAIFPDYFMARQRLGLVRLAHQQYAEAEKHFTAAVKINSRCFDCWYGLAYSHYSTGNFSSAIDAATKAVESKPQSVEANLVLGMAHRGAKNFPEAERYMLAASKISKGTSPDVHWNLALLYAKDLEKFSGREGTRRYLKAPDAQ